MIEKSCADIPIERGFIGRLQRQPACWYRREQASRQYSPHCRLIDLFCGAVDVHRLTRVQVDPNTRSRVTAGVAAVPHHDVDAAMAIARHVKGDDALAANGGEDGLVRPNRPKVLGEFIGSIQGCLRR